jgi:hypothetical protein
VALAKSIRWETAEHEADRVMTPEQIMDKLEARVGPKGRKLFEQFLRRVNKLQAQQYLDAQAQMGSPNAHANGGRFSPPAAVRTNRWNLTSRDSTLLAEIRDHIASAQCT